jgi:sigma-B regulation protein RsbU (phosphoserine phosphatase)
MNHHVAVYTESKTLFDQLKEAAESTTIMMDLNPEWNDEVKKGLVVCDLLSFEDKQELFSTVPRGNLYVISPLPDDENMRLIEKNELHHLVGQNEQIFAQEIVQHLKRQMARKLWGIATCLGPDANIKILSLSDSKFTNEMITEALGHFDFKDYFASPTEYLQVMANELISNSLYKGPNKKRAENGMDSVDRRSPVFLKGSELVQVTIGMDDKGIALSVQDSFGGLSYSVLIGSLKRSFEEKTVMEKKDGAGLGLYLTFLHSNQFIINYKENFRTEVICIIDKNKRYKNYKQRIRSFHFFQEVPGEKIIDK